MASGNKVAIEVSLDATGAVTGIQRIDSASLAWAKSTDQVTAALNAATRAAKADAEAIQLITDNAPDAWKETAHLGRESAKLGADLISLGGHGMNAKLAFDALGDSEANAGTKMFAAMGIFGSAKGVMADLGKTSDGLGKIWEEAGGKLGGLNSGLLGANVGMTGLIGVAVGAGLAVKKIIDLTAELKDEQGLLAEAEAKVNERTAHQREQEKLLASALGLTTAEMRERGITLENVTRLAKEDKTGEMTARLKEYRVAMHEVKFGEDERAAAAKAWQDAQAAAKKAIDDSSDALIKQKGILSDGEIQAKQNALAAGYDKIKSSAMGSAGAVKLFAGDMGDLLRQQLAQAGVANEKIAATGGELTKLIALAKENKIQLPAAFVAAAKAADEVNVKLAEQTKWMKALQEMEEDYQRAKDREREKSKKNREEKQKETEHELASIKLLTEAYKRAMDERESYKNFKFESDLSGSDDERVQVDKNDPNFKYDLAALKKATDYSGYGSGAAAALAAGDVVALKNLAKAIASDISMDIGLAPTKGGHYVAESQLGASQRATELSGVLNTINEALRHLADKAPQSDADRAAVNAAEESKQQTQILKEIRAGLAKPQYAIVTTEAAGKLYSEGKRADDRGLNAPGRH